MALFVAFIFKFRILIFGILYLNDEFYLSENFVCRSVLIIYLRI